MYQFQDIARQQDFYDLYESSVLCKSYFDNKGYLQEYPYEALTDEIILDKAYEIVLAELSEYGIIFTCEVDQLMSNYLDFRLVYLAKKFLDPNNLQTLISSTVELKNAFIDFCDELDLQDTLFIQELIEFLHTSFPNSGDIHTLLEKADWFSGSSSYNKDIKAIASKFQETAQIQDIQNVDQTCSLITSILEKRHKIRVFHENILKVFPSFDETRLTRIEQNYDAQKLRADSIEDFVLIHQFKTTLKDLEMPERLKLIDNAHRDGTPHHMEYYEKNPDALLDVYTLISVIGNLIADGMSPAQIMEAVQKFAQDNSRKLVSVHYELISKLPQLI